MSLPFLHVAAEVAVKRSVKNATPSLGRLPASPSLWKGKPMKGALCYYAVPDLFLMEQ